MRIWLPRDPSRRALAIAALCSLLLHVLLGAALYWSGRLASPPIVKRGEPLFVDIAPDKPAEPAPRGNPARPVSPTQPERERPVAPPKVAAAPPKPAPAPAPPAPKVAETPKPAEPTQVARAPVSPVPETPGPEPGPKAAEPAPAAKPAETAKPDSQEVSDPRFALSKPSLDTPPSIFRRPGGGGGLKGGGRGGVEGEPIPLDTPDPKFHDYFNQIRERIKSKWIYPREAGDRGIGGQLMIEFHIAKDGRLSFLELRRSSGVEILDDYALRAIQLAQPFPPVPDALARQVLPVSGLFTYQIVGNSFVNQYLR
jgi:protein TonB